jgi:hypothetical protein
MTKSGFPAITLVALEEALVSLSQANNCNNIERAGGHIGRAIIAIGAALQYAEAAALEVEERDKPTN